MGAYITGDTVNGILSVLIEQGGRTFWEGMVYWNQKVLWLAGMTLESLSKAKAGMLKSLNGLCLLGMTSGGPFERRMDGMLEAEGSLTMGNDKWSSFNSRRNAVLERGKAQWQ